jgi:hypothetical protein
LSQRSVLVLKLRSERSFLLFKLVVGALIAENLKRLDNSDRCRQMISSISLETAEPIT